MAFDSAGAALSPANTTPRSVRSTSGLLCEVTAVDQAVATGTRSYPTVVTGTYGITIAGASVRSRHVMPSSSLSAANAPSFRARVTFFRHSRRRKRLATGEQSTLAAGAADWQERRWRHLVRLTAIASRIWARSR
jgi:hypothetical protein